MASQSSFMTNHARDKLRSYQDLGFGLVMSTLYIMLESVIEIFVLVWKKEKEECMMSMLLNENNGDKESKKIK